ncbi:hypothetical protein RL72_00044 [Microbacterium azadirachtae]|uniref:Uncharacterized protein n=1 Tax=Microbacterium azadirachtae TaxID=582680 RepID=A0A0F0LPI9_9MICO|nr:hypothetical protein RL72_00044 [Microbacterium azadirachtae]
MSPPRSGRTSGVARPFSAFPSSGRLSLPSSVRLRGGKGAAGRETRREVSGRAEARDAAAHRLRLGSAGPLSRVRPSVPQGGFRTFEGCPIPLIAPAAWIPRVGSPSTSTDRTTPRTPPTRRRRTRSSSCATTPRPDPTLGIHAAGAMSGIGHPSNVRKPPWGTDGRTLDSGPADPRRSLCAAASRASARPDTSLRVSLPAAPFPPRNRTDEGRERRPEEGNAEKGRATPDVRPERGGLTPRGGRRARDRTSPPRRGAAHVQPRAARPHGSFRRSRRTARARHGSG